MKTSNKFLLGALLVFVVALVIYNSALKAEYLSGKYKDPFKNYVKYNINSFDEVEVNSSNLMHVTLKQGDFAVRRSVYSQDSIKFTRIGRRLVIDIDFSKEKIDSNKHIDNYNPYNEVIITCPKLNLLSTDNYLLVNHKMENGKDGSVDNNWNDNSVLVQKFNIDSLKINEKSGRIYLESNKITSFNSIAYGTSTLTLDAGNVIQEANFKMNDLSTLNISKLNISQITWQIADSAHVGLNGAVLKHLPNH